MPPELSPLTRQLVEHFFEPSDRTQASRRLVEECGNNLPFCQDQDQYRLERIRFAVLRLSLGYLQDLRETVDMAKRDWRDVLVWAGFGNSLSAHQEWAERTLKRNAEPLVIIVMGQSGAGKTTVGTLLARRLGWMYYETDNFLSTDDFDKVVRGEPLAAEVMASWAAKIRASIDKYIAKKQDAIFSCSALTESFRGELQVDEHVRFVYLRGEYVQLEQRQNKRKGDLPYLKRLAHEYKLLESPRDALVQDITRSPEEIADAIRMELQI